MNATGGESSIDEVETEEKIPGGVGIGSGVGDAKANITLEGKGTASLPRRARAMPPLSAT